MYLSHQPNQREVVQDGGARVSSLGPYFPEGLPHSEPFIFRVSDKDYSGILQPPDRPLAHSHSHHPVPKKPSCGGEY